MELRLFLESWNITLCTRNLKNNVRSGFDIWHTGLSKGVDDLINFWIKSGEF